jgi:hypothetical protein
MTRYRARYLDPEGDRYGLPAYPWQSAPLGLATRRQLRDRGLCPGGQPIAAQVMCGAAATTWWPTSTT